MVKRKTIAQATRGVNQDYQDDGFGYCHNNNDESDKEENGNSGNSNIFVNNLVWGDI